MHSNSHSYSHSHTNQINIRNSLVEGKTILNASLPTETYNWYACGPTVYDDAHIGHARTYVCSDIIRRIMINKFQLNVNYSMGLTDIDDKIIDKSITRGYKNWDEVRSMTNSYTEEFLEDMSILNVIKPYSILKVTDHIDEIIQYISKIIKNGYGYIIPNSGVYFDVSKLGNEYGKLGFGRHIDTNSNPDTSISNNISIEKKDKRDFALWKFTNTKQEHQDIKSVESSESVDSFQFDFESPWGEGRPGWHIECSALTHTLFGNNVDIHSGGIDLLFPHHTNEIAQCEAHNGTPWVKYWIHVGHLYIDGRKMSKSLKNFITIREFLFSHQEVMSSLSLPDEVEKNIDNVDSSHTDITHTNPNPNSTNHTPNSPYPAIDMRICFLLYKYHAPIHFSVDVFREAVQYRHKLEHLSDLISKTRDYVDTKDENGVCMNTSKVNAHSIQLTELLIQCQSNVSVAYRDDFDTPSALGHMSDLMRHATVYCNNIIRNVYKTPCPLEPLVAIVSFVVDELHILGVELPLHSTSSSSSGQSHVHTPMHTGVDNTINSNPNHSEVAIDELVKFRANIRKIAIDSIKNIKKSSKNDPNLSDSAELQTKMMTNFQNLLQECDEMRNEIALNKLNVDITDMNHGATSWKYKTD